MANLIPMPRMQFFDANGDPLSYGKLHTYVGGSVNTPLATYTDQGGGTPNANPVILDSGGWANVWLSNANYKLALTDQNDVTIWTVDNVTAAVSYTDIQSVIAAAVPGLLSQWILSALVPTYISATQFSFAGNQTSTFQVNRRIKAAVTAGTIYGTITVSSFATSITTVTVSWDSGSLDSGLSSISYSVLSATNQSIPPYQDSQIVLQNSADPTKKVGFSLSGLTTAKTRVITMPDYDVDLSYFRHGSVRFVNVASSATNVNLAPWNGNGLLVFNGTASEWQMVSFSSVGLTANITSCNLNGVGSQPLVNGTLYYAYVAFIGGTPQLDFSTTGHATSFTGNNIGVEIKNGDSTRTLVGMVFVGKASTYPGTTDGSLQGTASNQLVSGWFNRIFSDEYVSVSGSIPNNSYSEATNTNRINFTMWADDDPYCTATATVTSSTSSALITIGVGVDSATVPSGVQGNYQVASTGFQTSVFCQPITGGLGEGIHYLSFLAKISSGTGTINSGQIHLMLHS